MNIKPKICKKCNEEKFIKGKGLCTYCLNSLYMSKLTTKKQYTHPKKGKDLNTVKQKRPGYKRTTYCSESTLDITVSRLIRTLFPGKCFGVCNPKKKYNFSEVECAHFCVRKHKSTRFLLGNVLPACQSCNRFTPEHVYKLGTNIDSIFGEGSANRMINLSKKNCKLSPKIRKEMNTCLKSVHEQADNIIKQSKINNIDPKPELIALAVRTHEEQIKRFIEPNLI